MRILKIHTRYQQLGGEDISSAQESFILRNAGHEVLDLLYSNHELNGLSQLNKAFVTFWNTGVYDEVRNVIKKFSPDVVHLHNSFPYASPAVIHAVKSVGVPLVMTLHNYRLLCVNALFFRQGRICEDCLGHSTLRSVVHSCYRGSRSATVVAAGMNAFHRSLKTWSLVDRFVALTQFSKDKFVQGGIPVEKLVVKPNFLSVDPGVGTGDGGYALMVGRLSPEKGLNTLLSAWNKLKIKFPLKIVGDGPLSDQVRVASSTISGLQWFGQRSSEEVLDLMHHATFLIFPSEWYEGFPRVLVEAFAKGLPVVSTSIGSQGSIVDDFRTGRHFRSGDSDDLVAKVEWMLTRKNDVHLMRKQARAEFDLKYSAGENYRQLIEIYNSLVRCGSY